MAQPQFQSNQIVRLTTQQGIEKDYRLQRILGSGQTSIVWLANELNPDNTVLQSVALKILKAEMEDWRETFEREAALLEELREREKEAGYSPSVIPFLYNYSPRGKSPAFIALEYIDFPSVAEHARPQSHLLEDIDDLRNDVIALSLKTTRLNQILADSNIPKDLSATIIHLDAELRTSEQQLPKLIYRVETDTRQQQPLTSQDIICIGEQVCRALQVVHNAQRSYSDFQFANIHWNAGIRQVKMIDWNVVSSIGGHQPSVDIYKLAGFLFYLCTFVAAPEAGTTPAELVRLGGRAWRATPLGLRRVLERALSSEPERRYSQAFSTELRGNLAPLSKAASFSLGECFTLLRRYTEATETELIGLLVDCDKEKLFDDALVAIELNRINRKSNEMVNQFEKMALEQAGIDDFEKGRYHLDNRNFAAARQHFEIAIDKAPDDLEARRWLEVVKASVEQTVQFEQLWQQGTLQAALRLLSEAHYEDAWQMLKTIGLPALAADADLCFRLQQADQLWQSVNRIYDSAAVEQLLIPIQPGQLSTLERLTQLLAGIQFEQWPIPYRNTLVSTWPDLEKWSARVEEIRQKVDVVIQERNAANGNWGGSQFDASLARYMDAIKTHICDSVLLKAGLEQAKKCLSRGELEKGLQILDGLSLYVGDSPLLNQIVSQRRMAIQWQKLRRIMKDRALRPEIANLVETGHLSLPVEYAVVFGDELAQAFGDALEQKDLTGAESIATVENRLPNPPHDHQKRLQVACDEAKQIQRQKRAEQYKRFAVWLDKNHKEADLSLLNKEINELEEYLPSLADSN